MSRTNIIGIAAAVGLTAMGMIGTLYARELTVKECTDQFIAAVAAGTLMKTTWEQFRKAHCPSAPAADPRTRKVDADPKK